MEPVPDRWPPGPPRTSVVPLFPLPGAFLYPRTILPLRIFEPRYLQMLEDVLDEYVSVEAARDAYGVVLTGTLEELDLAIDVEATRGLRDSRRNGA